MFVSQHQHRRAHMRSLLFSIKIITLRLAALLAGCAILLLLCAMPRQQVFSPHM
jgi:hypothetical protein